MCSCVLFKSPAAALLATDIRSVRVCVTWPVTRVPVDASTDAVWFLQRASLVHTMASPRGPPARPACPACSTTRRARRPAHVRLCLAVMLYAPSLSVSWLPYLHGPAARIPKMCNSVRGSIACSALCGGYADMALGLFATEARVLGVQSATPTPTSRAPGRLAACLARLAPPPPAHVAARIAPERPTCTGMGQSEAVAQHRSQPTSTRFASFPTHADITV